MSESLAQWAEARESVVSNGPAAGSRQIELRTPGGVDLRVLPDRGFDIGQAWWRGRPLAWVDPSRDVPPIGNPRDRDWLLGYGGGLLTTCGLRHIGVPRDGQAMHGHYTFQRARVRDVGDQGVAVRARGVVAEPGEFDGLLGLDRTITTDVGAGRVEVADVVANRGAVTERLALLYHVNLLHRTGVPPRLTFCGRPVADAVLAAAGETTQLSVEEQETVSIEFEGGYANAVITLRWRTSALKYLYLWTYETRHGVVFAIEPATAAFEDPAGSARRLEPGDRLETGFTMLVRDALSGASHPSP